MKFYDRIKNEHDTPINAFKEDMKNFIKGIGKKIKGENIMETIWTGDGSIEIGDDGNIRIVNNTESSIAPSESNVQYSDENLFFDNDMKIPTDDNSIYLDTSDTHEDCIKGSETIKPVDINIGINGVEDDALIKISDEDIDKDYQSHDNSITFDVIQSANIQDALKKIDEISNKIDNGGSKENKSIIHEILGTSVEEIGDIISKAESDVKEKGSFTLSNMLNKILKNKIK